MFAEASFVPLTLHFESVGVDVLVEAVLVVALAMFGEEETTRHLGEIKTVQEFARVPLLTETPTVTQTGGPRYQEECRGNSDSSNTDNNRTRGLTGDSAYTPRFSRGDYD
jgi:hypothetical protein